MRDTDASIYEVPHSHRSDAYYRTLDHQHQHQHHHQLPPRRSQQADISEIRAPPPPAPDRAASVSCLLICQRGGSVSRFSPNATYDILTCPCDCHDEAPLTTREQHSEPLLPSRNSISISQLPKTQQASLAGPSHAE